VRILRGRRTPETHAQLTRGCSQSEGECAHLHASVSIGQSLEVVEEDALEEHDAVQEEHVELLHKVAQSVRQCREAVSENRGDGAL
jgi:hypothetical protein